MSNPFQTLKIPVPGATVQVRPDVPTSLGGAANVLLGAFREKKQPEGSAKFEKVTLPEGKGRQAISEGLTVTVMDNGAVKLNADMDGNGTLETLVNVPNSQGFTVFNSETGKTAAVTSPRADLFISQGAAAVADKWSLPDEQVGFAKLIVDAVNEAFPPPPPPAAAAPAAAKPPAKPAKKPQR